MTVAVDASAATELLGGDDERRSAVLAAVGGDPHWVVPEHFLIETISALRGRWLGGHLDRGGFEAAVSRIVDFQFDVWPTGPLVPRVLELVSNATSYDAAYLALAEELGCRLVTVDEQLSRVPGITCRVVGWE